MIGATRNTPRWVAPWCASALDLSPGTVAELCRLGRVNQVARAHLMRFPPGAVVRCICGCSGCLSFGIVAEINIAPVLSVTLAPTPHSRERRHEMTGASLATLRTIGYAGAWTPATVGLLLDGEEAGG